MKESRPQRPRYAPTVATVAIVLAIAGAASADRDDERRGNGIPNGSITLKEIDVPIYGDAVSDFEPIDGSDDYTAVYDRALPRERIHGNLSASADFVLTNNAAEPVVAHLRWVFDGTVRSVRALPLEPGEVAPATTLMSARLTGRDDHTLRLDVAGTGVRFEARSVAVQGLPGAPKDEE